MARRSWAKCSGVRLSPPVFALQRCQQRLGLLEISGVKALREPAVDRRQQRPRFVPLALLLPQAAEAHSSAQLQGFGLLAVGDVESPLEAGFCLRLWRPWLPQEQDALEAMDFRFPPAFVML